MVAVGTVTALVIGSAAVAAAGLLRPDRDANRRRWSGQTRPTRQRSRYPTAPARRTSPRPAPSPRSARWARPADVGDLVIRTSEPPPNGRLVLGRAGRRVVAAERSQSVIVFGPTQSHKTTGFAVLPHALLQSGLGSPP